MLITLAIVGLLCAPAQPGERPGDVVTVSADDTVISTSCTVRIAAGAVIADAAGDGVIAIGADNITLEFAPGAVLRGGAADARPDSFTGIGIRLDGHTGVTIRNATVTGYKVGLRATRCDGLTIDGGDWSGNYRQHLLSTPQAENGADWLFPHDNNRDQWTTQHGAALSIKNARGVVVHDVTITSGQNGIILDRVSGSRLYDNRVLFMSGWGIAMWRSSGNTISRNALEFCIRGYSHGVYNRGQDSAGLLMFEQCDDNVIAENSILYGGDGIFGFAGKEAIGETPAPAGFEYKGTGNARNIIAGNDLSGAAAHGLEMTFSHRSFVVGNRFDQNAICGIWGGYSQDFVIKGNAFRQNGDASGGLERGGINMEHAAGNFILENAFDQNACGVHLWWDDDGELLTRPGVAANDRGVTGNVIAGNTFTRDALALHLRDLSTGQDQVRGTVFAMNRLDEVKEVIRTDLRSDHRGGQTTGRAIEVRDAWDRKFPETPAFEVYGRTHPVGAHQSVGRDAIVMTEWGPWDHRGSLALFVGRTPRGDLYRFYGVRPEDISAQGEVELAISGELVKSEVLVRPKGASVAAYTLRAHAAGGFEREFSGTAMLTKWELSVFPWEGEPGPNPPKDLKAWRALAEAPGAMHATVEALAFDFGGRGPSQMGISPEITAAKMKADHFGIVARTSVALPRGKWRLKTTSDDGVRVRVDGSVVIDHMTHHGATEDTAVIEADGGERRIEVEYFEIFGAAVLKLEVEPAKD
jgi:parallel beta-helix repeat protein